MMRNDGKKKKLLTFVFSLLLIGLYFVIFRFSADDAESSSNLSMRVSEHVVRLYHRLSCRPENGEIISAAAAAAEGVIRKLAHFTEYMALGFLSPHMGYVGGQARQMLPACSGAAFSLSGSG